MALPPIGLQDLPLADLVSWLELNQPRFAYDGLANLPAAPVTPSVTALPGSPTDLEEVVLTDSLSTPTYAWLMKYFQGATKWMALGEVSPVEGTTTLTIPYAGTYYVEIGAAGNDAGGVASGGPGLSLTAGGITLVAGGGGAGGGTEGVQWSLFDKGKMTGLTLSQVLTPTVVGSPTRQYIRAYPVSLT